jgi:hypothetical protein
VSGGGRRGRDAAAKRAVVTMDGQKIDGDTANDIDLPHHFASSVSFTGLASSYRKATKGPGEIIPRRRSASGCAAP